MKFVVSKQWHITNTVLALLVIGFLLKRFDDHRAFMQGTEEVMGHVDDIQATTKLRTIFYSYEVGGQQFHGQYSDRHRFIIGPQWVIYAKSRPSLSTLDTADIESAYRIGLWAAVVGCLPFAGMWLVELKSLMRRRSER